MSAETEVHVLALDGIPEIRDGDDLGVFIANAIQRTRGALPLAADDVMVVTQKIVSKAEGAVVDLTTVEPRPEAIAFAERYDRDPRQIEVVLREARRVVRMTNGVLITETAQGFVCANGGVDASNVGPASGSHSSGAVSAVIDSLPHSRSPGSPGRSPSTHRAPTRTTRSLQPS